MADVRWIGNADKTAQVISGAIATLDATPANNTFTVTIGGVSISVAGVTSVAATAAALVGLLSASTHPYFFAITWANPSSGTITGTAKTAGIPFTATLTKSGGGTGTVTAFSTTTANSSPHDMAVVGNYSGGALPSNGDRLFIESNAVILWNLEAISGVTLAELHIPALTGLIGLNETQFVTDIADGVETPSDETKPEYRPTKLKVGATKAFVGRNDGTDVAAGPSRINLDFSNIQNALTVYKTAALSIDTNRPPLRVVGTHAGNTITVYGGVVGIATNNSVEVATYAIHQISGDIKVGPGVTHAGCKSRGGTIRFASAGTSATFDCQGCNAFIDADSGTVTAIYARSGAIVETTGGFTLTDAYLYGGRLNHKAGNIGTLHFLFGGIFDGSEAATAFTVTNSVAGVGGGTIISGPLIVWTDGVEVDPSSDTIATVTISYTI